MSFWILLWKLVFFVGIALFILMFIFITYKGFFENIRPIKSQTKIISN